MVDLISYLALRILLAFINLLPLPARLWLLTSISRTSLTLVPRYKSIAERNIAYAFPDSTQEWRAQVLERSHAFLARTIVDFARLSTLTPDWVREHVEFPFRERFAQIKRDNPNCGVMIGTGHLGSFELLAHSAPVFAKPIAFVVRSFKLWRIDRWWTAVREATGNRVVARKGAFKEIGRNLAAGWDVGLLIDQNVRQKHAVFVDLFGIPAATTKAFAIAALRAEAPVIVAGIIYLGNERYRIEAVECDFGVLYSNGAMTQDEKIVEITQQVSLAYEAIIRQQPEAWFWMHRRWKTRPVGQPENFY